MRGKWLILWFALVLSALVVAGCGSTKATATPGPSVAEDTPAPVQPTQPPEEPTKLPETPIDAPDPARARDLALAFLSGRYGEQAPALSPAWVEENVTPEGLVGATTWQYTSGDWTITVSFPIVAPDATIYQVVAANQGSGFEWQGEVSAAGQVTEQAAVEPTPAAPRPSEIVSLDENWNQYTNYQLGFSIEVPKTLVSFLGSCQWKEAEGDPSYRHEAAIIPVKIFEDAGSVYVTGEYYYELSGETTDDSGALFFSECNEVQNTLESLQEPMPREMWKFVVQDIQDDAELEAFIEARYGSGCSLGEKTASEQDGVYDVAILGDDKGLDETECPLNYWAILKYYPSASKVIAWNPGQSFTFAADLDYAVINDQEMIDSFRFLNGEPDASGSEPPEAPGPYEVTEGPVEGWVGRIVKFPLLAQLDDYFERDDGGQYGIEALDADPAIQQQIETLRWTGARVQVWGKLLDGALDMDNRQIQVERIEDLSGPATESRNLAIFATPSASSVLPADSWGTYEAFSALDGSLSTPWTEGVDGPGIGEWIMLTFPGAIEAHSIGVDVGYDREEDDPLRTAEIFEQNNRLKRATLVFSDGEEVELNFEDVRGIQVISLARAPNPVQTTFVKLIIEEVYPGSTFDDTCLAEIELWGATR